MSCGLHAAGWQGGVNVHEVLWWNNLPALEEGVLAAQATRGREEAVIGRPMRWLLSALAFLALLAFSAQFVPVYHVKHERDETEGALPFLKEIRGVQEAYFQQHGRYIGEEAWSEWPPGSFDSAEPRDWGTPRSGPWAEISIRPKRPLFFQFRLLAGEEGERAPKAHFLAPVEGPWYLVQARADQDGDGVLWLIETSSLMPSFYVENAGD